MDSSHHLASQLQTGKAVGNHPEVVQLQVVTTMGKDPLVSRLHSGDMVDNHLASLLPVGKAVGSDHLAFRLLTAMATGNFHLVV